LFLSFSEAAALWLLCNVCLLIASAILLTRVYRPNTRPLLLLLPSVLFLPVWEAINWGQLSVLLLFSVSLFLYGMDKKKDSLAAVALVLMTVKPQLFLVLGIALVWTTVSEKRLGPVLRASCLFAALVLLTLIISPDSISAWLAASSGGSSLQPTRGVYDWKPATLTTWLRILIPGLSEKIIWLLPTMVGSGSLAYLLTKKTTILWARHMPLILALSLLAAPYAWLYDQSLFLVSQMAIWLSFLNYRNSKTLILVVALLALQIAYGIMKGAEGIAQHHFAVFLPLWVLIGAGAITLRKEDQKQHQGHQDLLEETLPQ
jgi:hypothetical protein